jgi:hypothetical protein
MTGVETIRAAGTITVFHSGRISRLPITTACSPNELKVVQLRRMRWAEETSSRLSANIAPSFLKSCLLVRTPRRAGSARPRQRKRPRWDAACGNFFDT